MNNSDLLQLLYNTLPALIVGGVAFYFFKTYSENENRRRRFLLHQETQKTALPLKLQAYERMALFLERISPGNLLIRIRPETTDKIKYSNTLIAAIDQEFEHNLAQQIYVSNECWNYIKTAKNATISLIRQTAADNKVENAAMLQEKVLTVLMDQDSPTVAALSFVKSEVREFV
ncbi:hypothetical protein [Zunongwangia sp.]|uniref:DUF7935 family protein n=1 Tax=Zunongwangia sp. TaxID=1965325 RepID=UPI003AA8A59E